jgi:hypothetical protein
MSIVSGILGANAAQSGADQAAGTQNNANAELAREHNQTRQDFMPFYEAGLGALGDYTKMLKGGYDMQQSPAAMYEQQQGSKMLNRQLAARGQLGSGLAANRMTELSQGIAAKDWGAQYNRLLDAVKMGTGASASMGQAANAYGNQVQAGAANLGNIYSQNGQNRGSLYASMGPNAMAMGLKVYQAGKSAGLWGEGES